MDNEPQNNPQQDDTMVPETEVPMDEVQFEEDTPDNPPITWSAQEYVHLDRGPVWFVIFGVIVFGLIALDILFLRTWTLTALVVAMALAHDRGCMLSNGFIPLTNLSHSVLLKTATITRSCLFLGSGLHQACRYSSQKTPASVSLIFLANAYQWKTSNSTSSTSLCENFTSNPRPYLDFSLSV
jgi:hypothetical protein